MLYSLTWTETADVQLRVEKTTKSNFALLQPKFLVLGFSKKYDEGVELKDKTISKHRNDNACIISDVNILSVKGIYNAATPTVFGASMDGLNRIHTALLANR
jgi:hypothetical protein